MYREHVFGLTKRTLAPDGRSREKHNNPSKLREAVRRRGFLFHGRDGGAARNNTIPLAVMPGMRQA